MMDLRRIRSVALDIAGAENSFKKQEEVSDFIASLLNRNYQIYLYTTNKKENISGEDFRHPRLVFLAEEMPPSPALLQSYPHLLAQETLWITNDGPLLHWIKEGGLSYISLGRKQGFALEGESIARLSELAALLDPTRFVLDHVVERVGGLRAARPHGALLVGVGGPALSGYQRFAIELRYRLQDAGHELVELMDLSKLLRSTDDVLEDDKRRPGAWVHRGVGRWMKEEVIAPLKQGGQVYLPEPPALLPADFSAHFPLFVSEQTVLLMFAEMLFTPMIAQASDLRVLLELSAQETTRRLYEIPAGERFDPKLSEQYLAREGKVYQDYLGKIAAVARASIRVDANQDNTFYFSEAEAPASV